MSRERWVLRQAARRQRGFVAFRVLSHRGESLPHRYRPTTLGMVGFRRRRATR